jgi:DNA-binding MarR family transcriptional regulator
LHRTSASLPVRSAPSLETGVDLDASTQALIVILANRLTRNVSLYCRQRYKIGSIELRILMLLRRRQNLSSTQIAAQTDLDKAAVSRSLMTLQERGLIEFKSDRSQGQGKGQGKSRGRPLVLTPNGARTANELFEAMSKRHDKLFGDFSETQRRSFRRAVQRLITVSSDSSFKFGKTMEKTSRSAASRTGKKA